MKKKSIIALIIIGVILYLLWTHKDQILTLIKSLFGSVGGLIP